MDITVASLLRINGRPGHYVRIAGRWRLEEVRHHPLSDPTNNSSSSFPYCPGSLWEAQLSPIAPAKGSLGPTHPACRAQPLPCCPLQCHPSGCITDLFIQMAIIMLLKQTISNIMEYLIP